MACRDDLDLPCCRPAVVRAYTELRARGEPDQYCLDAALTVYRWHHPETPQPQALNIVSSWVDTPVLH